MFTLHIEHPITDFEVWARAYAGFADHRARSGVVSDRVARPVDDHRYVVIDLDFPTADQARSFETFLRERVWSSPELSPALGGAPRTLVVRAEQVAAGRSS